MIKKLILLVVFFSLLWTTEHVVSINGTNFTANEFFEFYPKSEWERITQKQKERIMKDFIRKKVAVIAAKEKSFFNNPRTAIKLRNFTSILIILHKRELIYIFVYYNEEF